MLKRNGWLVSGTNRGLRNTGRKGKTKPSRLVTAIKPILETLETRQLLSFSAGTLDPTFSGTGLVTTSLSTEDQGNDIAIDQTSGDIFVAGTSNNQFTLVAYSPTGSVIASDPVSIGVGTSSANAVRIDSSHNIWVAGVADDGSGKGNDFVLAEFTLTGSSLSLTSFGGGAHPGYVTNDVQTGKSDTANAVAIDGSDILVAGNTGTGTTQRAAVLAYNSGTGALDSGFGTSGEVIGSGTSESANGIAVGSSGIVVAGQASSKAEVLTMTSAGASLTAFAPSVGNSSNFTSAAVASNGDYLLAGTADNKFVLAAVTTAGALDTGFNGTGEIETSFTNSSEAGSASLALQSNGKIVVAGTETSSPGGNQFFAAARYNADGTPDTSFGSGGAFTTDFSGNNTAQSVASGVAIQPDGKIVAAGYSGAATDSFAVARYVANNAPTSANATAALDPVAENDDLSVGTSVATLVSRFGMTDPDGDTVALAIKGVENTFGTWQYNTGSTWVNIPAGVSDTNALLLAPSALIRFQPNNNDTGASTISVRAWDQTMGTSGTFANLTTNAGANYNSFSDNTYTASVSVSPTSPPTVVYVNSTFSGPVGSNVTDGFGQHTFGVDAFSTIQGGVTAVAASGTVEVDAGTYAESITITKPLMLLGAQAGNDPNARSAGFTGGKASPASESIITAPIVDPNDASNDLVHVDASNVTINGFVVDGNNAAIADQSAATSVNGVNTDSRRAIETENATGTLINASSVVIEYNVIQNFSQRGVELANASDTAAATSGDVVTQNVVNNFGITGVLMAFNAYGSVTHNTIVAPDNADAGIMVQDYTDNTTTPSAMDVSNNSVTVGQNNFGGVWVNLFHPTVATSLTLNTNIVNAGSAVTGTDGLTFGIYLSSINTTGPTVSLSGNQVGASGGQFAAGIALWNLPTATPVSVSGGSVSNSVVGIDLDNVDPNFGGGDSTTVSVSNVSVSGATTGIRVGAIGSGVAGNMTLNLTGGTLTGDTTGIEVQAASTGAFTASLNLQGGTAITGGTTGLQIDGKNASVVGNTLSNTSFSGQSGNYITLSNEALGTLTPVERLEAGGASFDGALGSALSLVSAPTAYAVEGKITDYLDDPTLGYVGLSTSNVFVAHSSETANAGSIQRGVNVAATGNTVNVQAGSFFANVMIPTSITLAGAGQGITTVYPAVSNPLGSGGGSLNGGSNILLVQADNVTIENLTADGNNPNLSSGQNSNGVDVDARNGIITDYNSATSIENDLNVNHVTVQNIYLRGIYAASGGTFDFEYNTVTNVEGDPNEAIGMFNYGGSGIMAHNGVSLTADALSANHSTGTTFAFNTVTDSGSGIHTDNNGDSGGVGDSIHDNNISLGTVGSYGIFVFVPYLNVSVQHNTISGVDLGLAAFGGQGGSAAFSTNTVSVNVGGTGAFVTTDTLGFGQMDVSASFSGDSFTGGDDGILVQQNTNSPPVTATVSITGVTVDDPTIGIEIDGGTATITGNTIYDNTTGIEFTAGGSGSVTSNNFSFGANTPAIDNTTDLLIDSTAGAVSIDDGNTFAATTDYIDNESTQSFDLSGYSSTTFGGTNAATLAVSGNLSTFYGIEDKIVDFLDKPASGYIRIKSGFEFVTQLSESTTLDAIQRAVTVAKSGDTVDVQAGTYTGNVVIASPLTSLTLNGNGVATINPSATTTNAIIISIAAPNVTVEGFTINVDQLHAAVGIGAISAASGANVFGGLQVLNNIINSTNGFGAKLVNPFGNTDAVGIAAVANGGSMAPSVTIAGNTILPTFSGSSVVSELGRGIWLNEAQGTIGGPNSGNANTVAGFLQDALIAFSRGTTTLQNNIFPSTGVTITEPNASAPTIIEGNSFTAAAPDDAALEIKHNYNSTSPVTISGNNFTVQSGEIGLLSAASIGVSVSGNIFNQAASSTGAVDIDVDTFIPSSTQPAAATLFPNSISITGNTFNADATDINATAIKFANHDSGVVSPDFGAVTVGGAGALANIFSTKLADFIVLAPPSNSVSFAGDSYTTPEVKPGNVSITIDASQNNFGVSSTDTLGSYTLADYFEIEDKVVDGVDYSGGGLVRLNAGNVYVTPNSFLSPTTTAASVQRAVDVSSPGDVVNIENGTYSGQVKITSNITLLGQSEAGTIIQAPASLVSMFTTSHANDPVVLVTLANATIENLTVNGNGAGTPVAQTGAGFEGIAFFNAGGTVNDVTAEHVRDGTFDGLQTGIAVYADNTTGTRTLNITNNLITDYQKGGMALSGTGLTVDVDGNTVTGHGPTTITAQNGIQVGFGAGGVINNNIVSGDAYTPATAGAAGILLFQSAAGTSVTNNTITGSQEAIFADDTTGNVQVTGNLINGSVGVFSGGFNGVSDAGFIGDYTIAFNTFENGDNDGIDLANNITGTTVENNLFQNNGDDALFLDSSVSDANGSLNATTNSFANNADAAVDNISSVTVNAANSWWNSPNGPTTPLNGFNVGSQGDKVIGPAIIAPWLISGANDAVGPGFAPHSTTTAAPIEDVTSGAFFGSIQAAVNAAAPSDTIDVGAGTYTENVLVNKNLIINGVGNGSDPASNTVVDSASATSPIFEITGAGTTVTLNGFYITGGSVGKSSGVQVDAGASATVSHVTVHDPVDGIGMNVLGTATIDGDTFENNSVGIQVGAVGVAFVLDGTQSHDNQIGLNVLSGGSATVDASAIFSNNIGIQSAGTLRVQHTATVLSNSVDGISVTDGSVVIDASEVSSNGTGVEETGGSVTIQDGAQIGGNSVSGVEGLSGAMEVDNSTIGNYTNSLGVAVVGNLRGFDAYGSKWTLKSTEVCGNGIGIDASSGSMSIQGGDFTGNSVEAVSVSGTASVSATNITIVSSPVLVSIGDGDMTVDSSSTLTADGGDAIEMSSGSLTVQGGSKILVAGGFAGIRATGGTVLVTGAGTTITSVAGATNTTGVLLSSSGAAGSPSTQGTISNGVTISGLSVGSETDIDCDCTVSDCVIENNVTGFLNAGGVVIVLDGEISVSSSLTSSNGSLTNYRGIQTTGGSTTIQGSTITGETIGVDMIAGGEVCDDGNNFTDNATGMQVSGGSATIGDSLGGNNFTDNAIGVDASDNGDVAMSGNIFTDNITGVIADSSVILVSSNDSWIYDASETATSVVGVQVTSNGSADISGGTASVQKNGSFSAADFNYIVSSGTVTVKGGTQISGFGTGIQVDSGSNLTVDGQNHFTNNMVGIAVKKQGSPSSGATGSGIVIGDSTNGGNTFSSNTTAISVEDGSATITGNTLTSNAVGLEATGGSVTVQENTFDDNTVSGIDIETGGTVIVNGGTIDNAALQSTQNGVVVYAGTGIVVNGGDLTFGGGTISHTAVGIQARPGNNKTTRIKVVREWSNDTTFINDNTTGVQIDDGSAIIGDSVVSGDPTTGGIDFSDNATAVVVDGDGQADLVDNTITGGQIGIDDSSTGVVTSTGDTISGTPGSPMIAGQRMHKPITITTGVDLISGDTISYAVTGIDAACSASISSCTINNVDTGISDISSSVPIIDSITASSNTITAKSVGLYISGVSGSLQNNKVYVIGGLDGSGDGIDLTNVGSSGSPITLSGNQVSFTGTTTSTGSGVDLEDTNGPVYATVDGIEISGFQFGIGRGISSSTGASADLVALSNSNIHDNAVGVQDTDGNGGLDRLTLSDNAISNNTTGVSLSGNIAAVLNGNTVIGGLTGIDDESSGVVTSTGDSIFGSSATDPLTSAVRVGRKGSMSMSADHLDFAVTGIDDDGTIHITSTSISDATTGLKAEDVSTVVVVVSGSSIIERCDTGLEIAGGTVTLDGTTVSDCITGVLVDGGTATIDACTIGGVGGTGGAGGNATGGARGLWVTGGSATVQNGTQIIDNTTGIEAGGGGATVTVIVDGSSVSGGTTGILVDAGQLVTLRNGSSISSATTGVDIEGGTANIVDSIVSDCIDGVQNDSETLTSSVSLVGSTLKDNATGITMSGGGDDSATLDSASKIILPDGGVGVLMTDTADTAETANNNTISGGTISDDTGSTNTIGIEVTDNLGKKHNYIGHVTIVKPTTGVEVFGLATLTGDTIGDNTIGVLVEGTGNATIGDDTTVGDGNNIYGNAIGIEFTGGSNGSVAGNAFFDDNNPLRHNAIDVQIDANAGAGITLGDGNAYDGDTDYIVSHESGHNWGMSHDANVTFSGFNAATSPVNATTLPTFYAIEDKIVDGIDQSGLGVVYIHDASVFVTPNSFLLPATDDTGAITRAIGAASDNDSVYVEEGSFSDDVTITKSISLLGAQASIDARTRATNHETILTSTDGFQAIAIEADNVTVDGFTIQGVNVDPNLNTGSLGAGIWMNPGARANDHGGAQILDNIIQDNIAGISLANDGTFQTVVQHNLIENNNVSGAGSGNGIEGNFTLDNALIDSNKFAGQTNGSITLTGGSNDVTISNDQMNGTGIFLINADTISITQSTISGAAGNAIELGGDVTNATIFRNTITGSTGAAISIDNPYGQAYGVDPNGGDITISENFLGRTSLADTNADDDNAYGIQIGKTTTAPALASDAVVKINTNFIFHNTIAGLDNESAVTVDATQNWWGAANGPTTPLNTFATTGTGDKVVGNATIAPWLDDGIDSQPGTPGFQHTPASVTAPAAPFALDLEAADDSGASNTDNITNVQTPHIDGSSSVTEAGDTVTLYDTDGTTVLGIGTVLSDGSWTVQTSVLANGAHTITAVITDGFGNQSAPSGPLTVDIDHLSPAPTITEDATDSDQEGALVSLTGAVNDPAPSFGSPSFDWNVVASNGQTIVDGTSQNFTFTPNDNGTYTVTYTVTDAAGNVGTAQDIITITNVAPIASLTTNIAPGTEGAAIDLTASATDPSTADTAAGFTYNWTITKQRGAGPVTTYLTGSFGPASTADINFTPDDDGTYVVTVTATDKDGGVSTITAASTKTFVVTNVAPTATITGAPTTSPAGVQINLGSTVTDPSSADTAAGFTYLWSVTLNGNSYTTDLGPTNGPTFTFTPVVFGNFVVSLKVTDKDGGSDTVTAPITVTEVTPAITLSGSKTDPTNPTPNDAEGSTFTLTLGALQDTDLIAGGDTVNQYSILWGDSGNATTITGAQLANLVANGGTVTHVYQDGTAAESSATNTNIQVFVTVTDGFGHQHSFDPATGGTLGINVYNVAPTGQLTGTTTVTEGTSGFVQFINQSDPSPTDVAAGFTYEYDFNNSGNFSAPTTSSSATVPASFLSTPGTITVAARIIDKDGGFTTDTINISVTNIAPSVNPIGNITNQPQGSAFHTTGSFTDPGSDSPWVVFVNYDSTNVPGIGSQIQSGSSKSFSLSNTYATPGTYTVLVTVQDLGGPSNNALSLSGSTTFTVTVTATTFQVTHFAPTPSGFDVTFNRPVNTSKLHLYGSSQIGGFGTTSDLTIVGQNTGPVTGSLVWDPTTNTAHFIKTGGPLAADTYSVVLLSGAGGWLDTSADQLDGQSNGGTSNYTNSFTVTTPSTEPVVSIPDFARGPGQPVNVPANGAGLNVQLSNASNIVSVDFDLVYNPSLLTITGATKAAGLPADWGITTNNVSAGQINFTVSGITPISGSLLNILTLTASIPTNAPYASAADLQLTNLVVSQLSVGTIPSLADSTMQKVAYLGDADGDGHLTGNDAGLISRVVVHLDTGFDAYQLTDPTLVGDVSGDGIITGFDASEDLSASVHLPEPTIPTIPSIGTLVRGGADPNISIPADVLDVNGTALVPVNIDDLTGVNGNTLTVGFDPTALQLPSGTNVTISSQLSSDWIAVYNPSTSEISFEDVSPQDATYTGPATLFNMSFTVPANSNPGVIPVSITGFSTVGSGQTALQYTFTNGSVVIPPTFTGNKQFIVALDGSGNVDVWQDVPETSTPTYVFSQSLLSLPAFNVFSFTTTQPGGSLTVDAVHGDPLPSGGATYNATGTGNALILDGDNNGDNFSVGSSGATWAASPLNVTNVQNFVFNGGTDNDTLTQTSQPAGTVTFNGGNGDDILNVNGGSYTAANDLGGGEANPSESMTVNVNNAGSSITFDGNQTLAALNVGDGAGATIAASSSTPSVLVTSGLSILGSGSLNMTNNEMIIHSNAVNRVAMMQATYNLIALGASFNNFATYWAGPGINSSSATGTGFTTGVGILLNDAGNLTTLGQTYTNSFGGQPVSDTDILVRYTYYGDADLSGKIDSTDYTLVDNGFNFGLAGWVDGDFNYDGKINGDDYSMMDNAFNEQNVVHLLAVNTSQIAVVAPAGKTTDATASTITTASNAVAAVAGSTADDTTDLKKKRRSVYSQIEDTTQSNS